MIRRRQHGRCLWVLLGTIVVLWHGPAFGAATISSAANQSFTAGDATTAISTITITDDPTTATINTTDDIRIRIPAGFNLVWDLDDVTATIGGDDAICDVVAGGDDEVTHCAHAEGAEQQPVGVAGGQGDTVFRQEGAQKAFTAVIVVAHHVGHGIINVEGIAEERHDGVFAACELAEPAASCNNCLNG